MDEPIQNLRKTIEPLRQEIMNHKVYSVINDIDDLKIFMQFHVYAVWDFMSLLKSLQNNLTCTTIPWYPKGSAETRHLINEIVLGEECDVDVHGNRKSHFELYLEAMEQCGANVNEIHQFIKTMKETGNFITAFEKAATPAAAQDFVYFTFDIIGSNKDYLQAAIFTFGREDLIPGMFHSIIQDIYKNLPNSISVFKYYLERHIEIDGDHHSHLALQMTSNLCGENTQYWQEAEVATITSLKKRIGLWDGAYASILKRKTVYSSQ